MPQQRFSGKAVRPHTLSLEWPHTAYTSLRTVVETVTRKAMGRGFVNGTPLPVTTRPARRGRRLTVWVGKMREVGDVRLFVRHLLLPLV